MSRDGRITSVGSGGSTIAYPEKIFGKKPVIPDGASVYTDKEGDKYYFAPSWGDIRKSPIIDMNFFLRIFAKQNKERQLMEERNKQNKE